MTPEQKRSELQRHSAILLATINYLLSKHGGSIVYDQKDIIADYYEEQKLQIEKYYKERRLNRLQQKLVSLTKGLQNRIDLNFANYIKENTGYDIDIFEELRSRVDVIIEQKEIRSQQELNDIGTMLHFYQKTSPDGEMVEKLRSLLIDYSKRTTSATSRSRKAGYSEIISKGEKEGIEKVTIRSSTGPKPKHLEMQESISPDGKRKVRVIQWSDAKHAVTSVVIEFPTASGPVYGTTGIHPDVKASWIDNTTVVIETQKDYTPIAQHREIRSFDDVITIEYIER